MHTNEHSVETHARTAPQRTTPANAAGNGTTTSTPAQDSRLGVAARAGNGAAPNPRKLRIAMIGLKGLPPRYGGFETAADEIGRWLVRSGHQVIVYNRPGMAPRGLRAYRGIRIVTLPTIRSKHLSSIVHAFLCSIWCVLQRADVVHYFVAGTMLFAPIPRIFGKKVICSVDGTDWQRKKWGRAARWYLRLSEQLAVWFAHALIADSREVQQYYEENYHAPSAFIPYGVRENDAMRGSDSARGGVLEQFGLAPREYVLFVGRLVPENNVHDLIEAFERVRTERKLVIVGDDPWGKMYVRALKSACDPRIVFTGGVYGAGYAQLQKSAYVFVLPDEVGGTHPSLVEAMGFGNCVLVNDTPSNLEVIGQAGLSYRGAEGARDLARQLQFLLENPPVVEEYRAKAAEHAAARYRWDAVATQHLELYRRLRAAPEAAGTEHGGKRSAPQRETASSAL